MRRLRTAVLLALLGFGLVAGLLPTGAVERLELLTLDARYVLGLGRKPPGDDIVVAWIDQDSMDYMDENGYPFPWPREVYAQALQHLVAVGARAVAFDLLFDQRGDNAEDDRGFGAALAENAGDALAMKFVEHRETGRDAEETAAFAARGLDAPGLARAREHGLVLPLPELAAGADQLGFVNIRPDADTVFRRYDLLRLWGPPGEAPRAYPSLALAAALARAPTESVSLRTGGGLALGSAPVVATDEGARMLLNFRGKEFTFEPVKFVNILESINRLDQGQAPLYPPERFRDKIVLVGIHAEGYEDAHPTPLSDRFPGVELHATALDNLLRGDALSAPRWELPLAAVAAVLATAVVFALPGVVAPLVALAVLLALGLAAALWAWTALVAVPLAAPALAGGTSAAGAFLYRLVVEGKQKRELQRAFRSYLAPEVLREVLRDPGAVRLGGEVREVTLFFTDLQGFTGLAEHTRPAELVAFLNDYFTRMCRPVLVERGVIDKFIGDALMAFFGAPIASPDHGRAAVRAALEALEVSAKISAELATRGLPPIQTRIGIHTGSAVVGNMGSSERFDYTAIGDTVNLASRLEGANKAFGTRCLVSETAWAMTGVGEGSEVLGREVGRIGVVGRQAPIRVFEPLALRARATPAELALAERWSAAVRALQAGERVECRAVLEGCAERLPDDGLTRLWLAKLDDPAFDGVFRLDGK
jgi:adenylate cyclase